MNLDLDGLLRQVLDGGDEQASDQFHELAQAASPDLVSQGLSAMFRSEQTPAFSQLVGQLFSQANNGQRAGMAARLIEGMAPAAFASLGAGSGDWGLGAILGRISQHGGAEVAAEAMAQLSPEQMQQIASHAEQHDPGIVDRMSAFCAEHPALVKTLGSAALGIAVAEIAGRRQA